ncbi:MAG: type III-B CRISPR module RAMP protein Cmr1 [Nannocystis sp.]|nr:type III-B CRISPR module RAMP protein Cmr1 [Nannocystis sp.]
MNAKVKVRTIEATFRVVTPLFSAGADPKVAEVRVPSLKGVLRFWWRALAWSEFGGDLAKIQEAEGELFGSAGHEARRSRVVMFLEGVSGGDSMTEGKLLKNSAGAVVGHGVRYLGYGLMGAFGANAGNIERACCGGSLEFKLHLRCRGVDDAAFGRLVRALEVLGTVGGLGARSRRGFGSLMLTSLAVDNVPSWGAPGTLAALGQDIRRLTGASLRSGEPTYTAFSAETRHVLVLGAAAERDPLVILDRVGREMVRYRSYGKGGRIFENTDDTERIFQLDHDVMLDVANRRPSQRSVHPRRVAFGLPHNYFFSSQPKGNAKASVTLARDLDRRASPLFIHVHILDNRPAVVLTFLPAKFLPASASKVRIGSQWVQLAQERDLYAPIRDFLARMMGAGRKEPFGEVLEVRHDAR